MRPARRRGPWADGSGGTGRPRRRLPLWLGMAVVICAAATALAAFRVQAARDMVRGLVHDSLLQQSQDLLGNLALEAGRMEGASAATLPARLVARPRLWPSHVRAVALCTRDGHVVRESVQDQGAAHSHLGDAEGAGGEGDAPLLAQAWAAADGAGHRQRETDRLAVAWGELREGPLQGARLAVVYSTARMDDAAGRAVAASIRSQLLQIGAVLLVVLAYVGIQAGALRRLARHARTAFQSAPDLGSPPPLHSPLVAGELVDLRDALQHANGLVNKELARNKELWQVFRSATSTGGEALVIVDSGSTVVLCNERVEILLCRPLAEVVGRPLGAVLAPLSATLLEAEMREFRRIGRHPSEGQAVERLVMRGDGHPVPVQMMLRSVSFDGAPCLCVSLRELSEEKQQERKLGDALAQAQQAHAAKARFLANMSHEIRTPLNGITGMAHLLSGTPLDAHQQDLLHTLGASTQRLRVLLDDILDLSKIEAGHLRMERRPFDAELELRRAVRAFQGAAVAKGLSLHYAFHGEPRAVIGDSHRLTQIVHNLLDNAIKFTETGQVSVTATARAEGTAGDAHCRLDVEVRDTGPGVPPELQGVLFAAFTQADETTTRRFGGTGLGLALSRELCQAMQGDIAVTCTPGGGATFRFHVRAALAPTPEAIAAQAATAAPPPEPVALRGRRVLVADDSPVNRKVLEHLLRGAGIGVDHALDGTEALQRASAADYDVILMDVSMPRMSGYDATRGIRALTGHRGRVPVIGVTALAMEGDRERCLAAGMNGYVAKPIQSDELFGAIRVALRSAVAA